MIDRPGIGATQFRLTFHEGWLNRHLIEPYHLMIYGMLELCGIPTEYAGKLILVEADEDDEEPLSLIIDGKVMSSVWIGHRMFHWKWKNGYL